MRLQETKIKEAILHPDLDIRDKAIRYYDGSTRDPTLMPLAIQSLEKHGRTKAFTFIHYLILLSQTDQTIDWVIGELQRDFEAIPEEKYYYFLNLSRLLNSADIRLLVPRASEILGAPHFDAKEHVRLCERLEMFGWDAEKCWRALHEYCEANKDKNNIEEFSLGHALRITEALARQPHEYQEQIVALLEQEVHDFRKDVRKWLQPLMADLAGKMRLPAAVPSLVANLGHSYAFLSDQSLFALAEIGTEEVVTLVCDQFPRASRDFRLYASELLGKIHLDVTVQRVQELLPGEKDLTIRINLCEALIDHFSFEAIEPARHLIKHQELTPDVRHLRSNLIAYCKIMKSRFPEFDAWEVEADKDVQHERTKITEIQKMAFKAGGDLGPLVEEMEAQLVEKLQAQIAEKRLKIKELEAKLAAKERSLGREAARSAMSKPTKSARNGRNDRCSCGSGKKFKHCCMNKQTWF